MSSTLPPEFVSLQPCPLIFFCSLPEARNTKHKTQNTKPQTKNTKHETRNTKYETRNPKPETLTSVTCILQGGGVAITVLSKPGRVWTHGQPDSQISAAGRGGGGGEDGAGRQVSPRPCTLHQKPEIRNHKPQTRSLKLRPKPGVLNRTRYSPNLDHQVARQENYSRLQEPLS